MQNNLGVSIRISAISDDDPHYKDTIRLRKEEKKLFNFWEDSHTIIVIDKVPKRE